MGTELASSSQSEHRVKEELLDEEDVDEVGTEIPSSSGSEQRAVRREHQ